MILAVFVASLLTAIIGVFLLIPRLHRAGIAGRDMNKPRRNTTVMYDSPREIHETPPISTGQAGVDTTRGKSDGVDNPEDIPRGRAAYPEVAEMGGLA